MIESRFEYLNRQVKFEATNDIKFQSMKGLMTIDHKQRGAVLSVSQCAVPVYLKWQMSWGSEDTYVASLLCECMCASSKISLSQNSSHSVYSGKDAHL